MRDIDHLSEQFVEAELPPFLFTRIEAAISRKKAAQIPSTRAWVMALVLVSGLVMNYQMIRKSVRISEDHSNQALIEIPNNQLYHE